MKKDPKSRLKRQDEFMEFEIDVLVIEQMQEKGHLIEISPILKTPEEILRFPHCCST